MQASPGWLVLEGKSILYLPFSCHEITDTWTPTHPLAKGSSKSFAEMMFAILIYSQT
jgi:hypothetical protein